MGAQGFAGRGISKTKIGAMLLSILKYGKYSRNQSLNQAISVFCGTGAAGGGLKAFKLKRRIIEDRIRYQIAWDEYFLYSFPLLSHQGKLTYVGNKERADIFRTLGTKEMQELFDNKYATYLRFKQYYRREAVMISSEGDREAFDSFTEAHGDFMVKAPRLAMGKGIFRVRTGDEGFDKDALFERILSLGGCLLEERIPASGPLADFHPQSVNSLRIATYLKDGKVDILFTFIRMGRGDSCVDNGGMGGIIASVDRKTGIVDSIGITENGETFLCHPDSGKQIIGFMVPDFDDAVKLAREASSLVPEQPCIGWDLAWTENGWVIIEGNRATQFYGPQMTHPFGIRKEMGRYFRGMSV